MEDDEIRLCTEDESDEALDMAERIYGGLEGLDAQIVAAALGVTMGLVSAHSANQDLIMDNFMSGYRAVFAENDSTSGDLN
jgi:hypothetical protein